MVAGCQGVLETLRMPSDADLLKTAIADLLNSSSVVEDRHRALQELWELVESIDNAKGVGSLLPMQ